MYALQSQAYNIFLLLTSPKKLIRLHQAYISQNINVFSAIKCKESLHVVTKNIYLVVWLPGVLPGPRSGSEPLFVEQLSMLVSSRLDPVPLPSMIPRS